ncbi:hypothetical protein ACFQ08_23015, partial [Streptosporangium algeriense]
MSSVLLYLAIVVMWLCVLVPMWLRRDRVTFTEHIEHTEDAEPYVQDEEEHLSEDSIETQRDIVLPATPPAPVVRENLAGPSGPHSAEASAPRSAGASGPRENPAPPARPVR